MTEQSDERTLERFWAKVAVDEETSCMLWTASQDGRGYGLFRVGGKMAKAHRFAWEAVNGQIPEGLQIDHLCRVRHCVNPGHLEPVDCRTNLLRGVGVNAVNAAKTECSYGHPFDEVNTYIRPDGARRCRTCQRRWDQEYRASKRAAVMQEQDAARRELRERLARLADWAVSHLPHHHPGTCGWDCPFTEGDEPGAYVDQDGTVHAWEWDPTDPYREETVDVVRLVAPDEGRQA